MPARKLNRLPTLPTVAAEILNIFSDPEASTQRLSSLILADPALSSKLLRVANSSRFGLQREVSDVRQAIALLGRGRITPIILSFSLASESLESPEHSDSFKRYWLRSFVQATTGEILGARYGDHFASECFTVNLLAGIGQLSLLKQDVEKYLECLTRAEADEGRLSDVEVDIYGATSQQITLEMLRETGLPDRCLKSITAMTSDEYRNDECPEVVRCGNIVAIADAFARYLCDSETGLAWVLLQDRIGLLDDSELDIERLTTQVREKLDESAALFDINPDHLPDPAELLSEAMSQLADFTERIELNRPLPDELMVENGRLKEQVEQLVRQTTTDALTGIANRAFFDRRLSEITQQAVRRGRAMGIAVIDIDHFKQVNDRFGHPAGDLVLREVAASLKATVRTSETLARYGGEEFAILLEDVNPEGMRVFGERVRAVVESLQILADGVEIPVTISIGIACDVPKSDTFGSELFARADAALYKSKEGGRNRVTLEWPENIPPEALGGGAGAAVQDAAIA